MGIFGAYRFVPPAIVAKEILESPLYGIEGMFQECCIAESCRLRRWFDLPTLMFFRLPQQHCKNESARIVVGGISLPAVRDRENRMLQHPSVVGHPVKVTQLQLWQLTQRFLNQMRGELDFWAFHAITSYPRETFHVALRHSFPDRIAGEEISPFAHPMTNRRCVQQFNRLLRNRVWILEWHQRAPAVVQQLDRMPIGSGDDRFACPKRISQRSGDDLCLIPVRSDVNVGGADELNHFLGTDEAVMEDDLRFHSDFLRQSLQTGSVPVPFATQDVRMGRARNNVNHILVFRQNLRQRLNYVFDSLVRREQAEGDEYRFPFHSEAVFVEIRIQERKVGNAVRNHVDLAARHLIDFLQKLGRKLAHHNQAV